MKHVSILDVLLRMSAEYKADFLPRMLRLTTELTREDLCTRLTNDKSLCER